MTDRIEFGGFGDLSRYAELVERIDGLVEDEPLHLAVAPFLHRIEPGDLDDDPRVVPFPGDPARAALIAAYAREHGIDEATAREQLDRVADAWGQAAQTLGRALVEFGAAAARAWRDIEQVLARRGRRPDGSFAASMAEGIRQGGEWERARRERGTGPPPARLDGRRR